MAVADKTSDEQQQRNVDRMDNRFKFFTNFLFGNFIAKVIFSFYHLKLKLAFKLLIGIFVFSNAITALFAT